MPPRGPLPPHLLRRPSPPLGPLHRAFSLPTFSIPGLPAATTQTIQARRTLPYPPPQVYALIADVDSYATFLPFCTSSRVTRLSPPDPSSGRRWPTQADLTVGWGPVSESYTSRLYCVPGEVVEAVSGAADTTIPEATLRRHGLGPWGAHAAAVGAAGGRQQATAGVFDSLLTRWAVHPVAARGGGVGRAGEATEVTLSIRYRFANPAYGLAVGRVADDMVGMMIEAFEKRAKQMYDGQEAGRAS
ncbi:dehydrase and lipid transport-domain-containing protein [Phialemonium atrogriseum]|uniref:Dehydrase and lipid transport-domain-containing protein n=1 Tax=Phialemonium atrogriseum TaxID=1093897 RepID=A0AAJ0FPY8_9PEZI|nr:dehydrase and lipid transport-domain-containing protein [Phialemonium atrogriseum]KAK1770669.1 dehydrase and lipid transport-domain-containing protein [Phialemonium atrogriseum]